MRELAGSRIGREGARAHHPSLAIQRTNAVLPESTSVLIQSLKLSGVRVMVHSGFISWAEPAQRKTKAARGTSVSRRGGGLAGGETAVLLWVRNG